MAGRLVILVTILGVILAACGASGDPAATMRVSPDPTRVPPSSAAVTPNPTTIVASPTPVATPDPTPSASLAPVTPAPSPAASPSPTPAPTPAIGWNRVKWRQLAADDPLTRSRSVTPWSGGYVALGERLAEAGSGGRNMVWISTDGIDWTQLPTDAFGSTSVVTSVASTKGGIVALTLELGLDLCEGSSNSLGCYVLEGPVRAWTSADGWTWTDHPLAGIPLPDEMTGYEDEHLVLQAGIAPLLLVRFGGRWLAVSDDGVTWDRLRASDLPRGWRSAGIAAFREEVIAVGTWREGPIALHSADGRVWTSTSMPPRCGGPTGSRSMWEALVAGPEGLVAQGSEYSGGGVEAYVWCSSLNGRSWHVLDSYPPLGPWEKRDECRDVCPNGIVVGDGKHLIAYRGYGTQAAWASLDGRTWKPLAVRGSEPVRWTNPTYPITLELTTLGLIARNGSQDAAWIGEFRP